jgi:hypothetical protein
MGESNGCYGVLIGANRMLSVPINATNVSLKRIILAPATQSESEAVTLPVTVISPVAVILAD